ncbi:MAG: hypothetical protein AAGC56_14590 [Pseudomonadota bacterium]
MRIIRPASPPSGAARLLHRAAFNVLSVAAVATVIAMKTPAADAPGPIASLAETE